MKPEDSKRQIERFAYRVGRRLAAAGAPSHLIEDVKQELWIAWLKACERYDPQGGASFSTYLANGMRLHINRWVDDNVSHRHAEVVALSIDFQMGDDEDGGSLEAVLPDRQPSPEETLMEKIDLERALEDLPPRAAQFVRLLADPPAALFEQLFAVQARSAYGSKLGISSPVRAHISSGLIFDLMGATRLERSSIFRQIREYTDDLKRA